MPAGPQRSPRRTFWFSAAVLCAVLGIFGLYRYLTGADEPEIRARTIDLDTAARTADPATDQVEDVIVPKVVTGEPAPDTVVASGEQSIEETAPPLIKSGPATRGARDIFASAADRSSDTTTKAETRDTRPAPQRTSQARRQRSGDERPRIVPVFEEPSVGSIETILTGVPSEKRRRWRDRWDDEEDFRRWRIRQRRNNRRDFPPF